MRLNNLRIGVKVFGVLKTWTVPPECFALI